jgi:hypothetical protein
MSEIDIKVVFRPHPSNQVPCEYLSYLVYKADENVTLPDSKRSKETFYHLISNAVCTIGINTSAMIDSLVLIKPTIGLVTEEYTNTQSKSIHFQSLKKYEILYEVSSPEEVLDLALMTSNSKSHRDRLVNFRDRFAFPHGTRSTVADNITEYIFHYWEMH